MRLIVETSTDQALIALADKEMILDHEIIDKGKSYSVSLMPVIQKMIGDHKLELIAVGKGPGSYTGTRAGVAIAKGLAYGLGIPLVGFYSPLAFLPKGSGTFQVLVKAKCGDHLLLKCTKDNNKILEHSFHRQDKPVDGTIGLQEMNPAPLPSVIEPRSESLELVYFHNFD